MHKTATAMLIKIVLLLTLGIPTAQGDRPKSYDTPHKGQRSRAGIGQRPQGAGNAHNSPRHGSPRHGSPRHSSPRHSSPHHGTGRLQHRSSIGLYIGGPSAYLYSPVFSYGSYYPGWNYSNWGPTGIYYNPSANYSEYYLPPSYMPAELNYGPQALDRFLGIRRPAPAVAPTVVPAASADAIPDAVKAASVASRLRKSNATARESAQRYLVFGDALFLKQKCHAAAQRYKSAISIAPDLPEAYYRQGFALLTVKQYRLAAKALRIAVELDPEMLRRDMLVHRLYGDNTLAKSAHLEELADQALANPRDGDLLFLIGAFLYADGEGDRAVRFLQKAYELADPEGGFLTPLLIPAAPADAKAAELDT